MFYDGLDGGILLVSDDEEERLLFASAGMLRLFECPSEDEFLALTGGTYAGMVSRRDESTLSSHMHGAEKSAVFYFHYWTPEKNVQTAEAAVSRQVIDGQKVYLCQVLPVDSRHFVKPDDLTDLPGVMEFDARSFNLLRQYLQDGSLENYAAAAFNVSHFKEYNRAAGVHAGNQIIAEIGDILREMFPGCLVGHLGGDDFAAVVPREGLIARAEAAADYINTRLNEPGAALKAGFYYPEKDTDEETLRRAMDMARTACESIKESPESTAVFVPSMADRAEMRSYIVHHFEKALNAGWIKVYYQPIIRTLTGKICGYEALSRWEDPERGLIKPGLYVPILEEARMIGRLDAFVIENVCRLLHDRKRNGYAVLPVSLNLSRVDFALIHPLEILVKACEKYEITHDLIHAEIRESFRRWSPQVLSEVTESFHQAGFEIWLDDFGSAHSPLNLLHHNDFDVLKIDLDFFRSFDEKGRRIMTSTVLMAKELKMRVLAQGAETKQQVEFLKRIGCDAVQGFYYQKAEPFEDGAVMAAQAGIQSESPLEREVFNEAGMVNVITEKPTAIFVFDGNVPTFLTMNQAFLDVLATVNTPDMETANRNLQEDRFAASAKVRGFLRKAGMGTAESSGMTYVDNGQYMRLEAHKIAGPENRWVGWASLTNLSVDAGIRQTDAFDAVFRNVMLIFDGIYYFDRRQSLIQVIESTEPAFSAGQSLPLTKETVDTFAAMTIHPDDQKRFRAFFEMDRLTETAAASGRSEAVSLFRVRKFDGNFRWTVFHAIVLFKSEYKDILLLERDDIWERQDNRKKYFGEFMKLFGVSDSDSTDLDSEAESRGVLDAFRHDSGLMFAWKDTRGKIRGISDALAKMIGIGPEEAVGRTEEEIGAYFDPERTAEEEKKVMYGGETVHSVRTVNVHGITHTARTVKFPYYRGEKLAGIVGTVYADEDTESRSRQFFTDAETGFLNMAGMAQAAEKYDNALRCGGGDYIAAAVEAVTEQLLPQAVRAGFAAKAVRCGKEALQGRNLQMVTVARPMSTCFVLLGRDVYAESVKEALDVLSHALTAIDEVQNIACRTVLKTAQVYGSEADSSMHMLTKLFARLEQSDLKDCASVPQDELVISREALEDMPERCIVADPNTYEIHFMNKAVRRDLNLPDTYDWHGKKCYEVLEGRDSPCPFCTAETLRRDHIHVWSRTWQNSGKHILMRDMLVPWKKGSLMLEMGICLDDYPDHVPEDGSVRQERGVSEAIAAGIAEENPEEGIIKTICSSGRSLKADRVLIFEERDDRTLSCTYEYCAEGQVPLQADLKSVLRSSIQPLYEKIGDRKTVLIENYAGFKKENPDLHLPIGKAENLACGRLTDTGELIGLILAVNVDEAVFSHSLVPLTALNGFIAMLLRNRNSIAKLYEQTRRDALTGTLNRRGLEEYLEKYDGSHPIVLVSCDINGLKDVNDRRGHAAGDDLIRRGASVLVRFADANHVFRMGGDEFLMVLENMDEEGVSVLLERMNDELKDQNVSMAIGFASHQSGKADADSLLSEADAAMYKDKSRMYRKRIFR